MNCSEAQLAFVVLILFTSCRSDLFCDSKNTNDGEIVRSFEPDCFPNSGHDEYVIRNSEEFFQEFSCDTLGETSIDFTAHTLLGYYTDGKCEPKIKRKVKIDHDNSTVEYIIKNRGCGYCLSKYMSYNWVLIPAFPDSYNVNFVEE